MKIDSTIAAQRSSAAQAQKEVVQREQAELAKMQKLHRERRQTMQVAQERELVKLHDKQRKINQAKQEELAAATQRLVAIRQKGQQEAEALGRQQAMLQKQYFQQNQMLRAERANQQAALREEFEQQARELRAKTAAAQAKLAAQTDQTLWEEEYRHQHRLAQQSRAHGEEQRALSIQQEKALQKENMIYQQQLRTLQRDHFDQLERIRRINEEQDRNYQKNFELTSARQKQYYQDQRIKEDQALQKNFDLHRQQLAAALGEVQQKMAQSIAAAQQNAAYLKQAVDDKLADHFYRFEQLPATLQENEQGVTLSVKVPPYEKSNVFLHVNGQQLRLSFSRRVDQQLAQPDGTGRYARSESLSQEFKASQILDPKSVKQSYRDGVLTFSVARA